MSQHYLLDAYNIIKQVPRLADLPIEEGREALLRWINLSRPQGSLSNLVTVIFDGHASCSNAGTVEVVFSKTVTADDVIKRVIDNAKNKKNFVVVSNDKGITLYVRAQGATIISVKEFAKEFFVSKPKKLKDDKAVSSKHVSLSMTDKINKELSKLWLK